MKVKTISYKRILNLGNYESKHLEMSIEVDGCLELAEEECSVLMETVERKIREDQSVAIREEIMSLRSMLRSLKTEERQLLNKDNVQEETFEGNPL
ncbi:hypothetical protein [Anabaena sp. PCC 7108]|uniref:hypothetical protein n=1 Tax=Anabaena sp. PCC 7108 TaxID=163908 RepID=UPI00034C3EE5|nr:hypothetical protein [Anabaena sp. PCC 7108]